MLGNELEGKGNNRKKWALGVGPHLQKGCAVLLGLDREYISLSWVVTLVLFTCHPKLPHMPLVPVPQL